MQGLLQGKQAPEFLENLYFVFQRPGKMRLNINWCDNEQIVIVRLLILAFINLHLGKKQRSATAKKALMN